MNREIKVENLNINTEEITMENTPQELIQSTINKVEEILNSKYPDHTKFEEGQYVINRGSTQVMVLVRPFTEKDTAVECIANVVSGADISAELMKFLLRKNAEIHFGSFGLLFDDTISFSHCITGTNLDANELIVSINSVAIIADHYDDEIVKIAGGKRLIDSLDDEE